MSYIRFTAFVSVLVAIFQMLWGCANVQPPTGGDKDTLAPTVKEMMPAHKQLGYTDNKIEINFSEIVESKNIRKELIVNPPLKYPLKIKEQKNKITFTIKDTLAEQTTYTFNFRNAITDVTENNPVKNLVLTFSTGDFIDSFYVRGKAINFFTQEPITENGVLLLYNTGDTVAKSTPVYYSELTDQGYFNLENIKNQNYTGLIIKDDDKNGKPNLKNEAYSIFDIVQDSTPYYTQSLIKIDTGRLETDAKKKDGNALRIDFNKNLLSASINPVDSFQYFIDYEPRKNNLYIYPIVKPEGDTLKFVPEIEDSVGRKINKDTIVFFFEPDTSAKKKLTFAAELKYESFGNNSKQLILTFSEPVKGYNEDSIFIKYDNNEGKFDELKPEWNPARKKLTLTVPDDVKDSITVITGDSAWHTYYYRYSAKFEYKNDLTDEGDFGSIEGKILNDSANVIVQLLTDKYEPVKETTNREYKFVKVKPGSYRLRYIVDENKNGKWDINMENPGKSEKIIYFKDVILLKPNWEITEQNF